MNDLFANQVILGALSVWIIQKLKGWAKVPVVNQATDRLNRGLSVVLATLSAAGILVAANWSGWDTGTLTITVTGLTAANIAGLVWMALKSFIIQEVFYRGQKQLNAASLLAGKG